MKLITFNGLIFYLKRVGVEYRIIEEGAYNKRPPPFPELKVFSKRSIPTTKSTTSDQSHTPSLFLERKAKQETLRLNS